VVIIPGAGVLMAQVFDGGPKVGGQVVKPYLHARFTAEERKHVDVTETDDGTRYFTAVNRSIEFLDNENAVKVVDFPEKPGEVKVDLVVDPGKTVAVRVRDADGKPLSGTVVAGMTASWPNTFRVEKDAFTAYALDPAHPRRLLFYHAGRNLAGTLTLRGDEKEAPVVRLGPAGAVTGRVLDADGEPIAGAVVGLYFTDRTAQELERQRDQGREVVRTGKDGRFRLEGLVPNVKFGLQIQQGRVYLVGQPKIGFREVGPGATLDLGAFRVKPQ